MPFPLFVRFIMPKTAYSHRGKRRDVTSTVISEAGFPERRTF
jgi:hypothetical protein